MGDKRSVVVVGAGIIGLTTAVRLREAGHDVSVVAHVTPEIALKEPVERYCSIGSGGFWMPFYSEGDQIEEWASEAYRVFSEDARRGEQTGVQIHEGFNLKAQHVPTRDELPWYADLTKMEVVTPQQDARIPKEYMCGLRFTSPIVQMSQYLRFLSTRLTDLGVPVLSTTDADAAAGVRTDGQWDYERVCAHARATYPGEPDAQLILVCCCGIGSRAFQNDAAVTPGRGVTVRVKRPAHINYFITEDEADGHLSRDGLLAYALPRGDEYTLGGTIYDDWTETSTPAEASGVVTRATTLIPALAASTQTGQWTGLRPLRARGARVAVEDTAPIVTVSNYGHGGSGVTVSWGCAAAVARLIAARR